MLRMAQNGQWPRVVIIGGGFAGMNAAKALAKAPVKVTLIDRKNHHTFQPLLYQVALAVLSPAEIACPIRAVLRRAGNVEVLLGEVTGFDLEKRLVKAGDLDLAYDYLIVAAGATHAYFGHPEWERIAPGLKTIEDAIEIRRRILMAFEVAERESIIHGKRIDLNFVVIGAGPTGVELAGAISDTRADTWSTIFAPLSRGRRASSCWKAGPGSCPPFLKTFQPAQKSNLPIWV